jgi:hypothetical protein
MVWRLAVERRRDRANRTAHQRQRDAKSYGRAGWHTLSSQRPDLVPGVPLYLDYGTTGRWLNPAAFAPPAVGKWGNFGRNVLRAPGLFQIDTGLSRRTRITERVSLDSGVEIFNILNHPQLRSSRRQHQLHI